MALTPAVLSKLPLGLLGFFGIKNGGQYPQTLGEVIVPQLDMLELLAANYCERISAAVAVNAIGFAQAVEIGSGLNCIVPDAQVWYVPKYTIGALTGAGESVTFTGMVQHTQSGTASNWYHAMTEALTLGASGNIYAPAAPGAGKWFGPGSRFGFWTASVAGPVDLTSSLEIVRFPF